MKIYHGITWYTMELHGISWYFTMVYLFQYTMVFTMDGHQVHVWSTGHVCHFNQEPTLRIHLKISAPTFEGSGIFQKGLASISLATVCRTHLPSMHSVLLTVMEIMYALRIWVHA